MRRSSGFGRGGAASGGEEALTLRRKEIGAGSSARGIQRRFNSLNADALPVRNTTGLLDILDVGNSALVQRHFLNRCESGRLKQRFKRISIVHPFVLMKILPCRIDAI